MKEFDLRKNIADNLRIQRAKFRLSQENLAEKAGISTKYLTQIENEKVNPSIFVLVKLAIALDITVDALIY